MKRRGLTPEDREVWSRYSRTAEPMHSVQPTSEPRPDPPKVEPPARIDPFRAGQTARTVLPPPASKPASLRMDAKTHRRMASGKLRPEATIDLHGMTLDVAHPALARFILSSHAKGRRLVVVVTGKGRTGASDDPFGRDRGVLKRQVPHWLRLPPLSAVVLQVSEAHRSHGGSGACYVYLRRSG
ncbi:Smr/MutS family protein [Jannaschia rubra]|uniref:Putative DNA endonuclease SmrA n=1 Tax=Jannaschia rubra TaxID=282197 RepID=A0A0M6XNX3_9RHOB|nr:Smr/MutS family protein [Jannaschia rubra]CTQ32789.1 putative DNA endonuclease SmrA [Jannaschia rubra]SFF89512.1 DNA-nicking endonuclease, Smr domain [Jannaschia rubra]